MSQPGLLQPSRMDRIDGGPGAQSELPWWLSLNPTTNIFGGFHRSWFLDSLVSHYQLPMVIISQNQLINHVWYVVLALGSPPQVGACLYSCLSCPPVATPKHDHTLTTRRISSCKLNVNMNMRQSFWAATKLSEHFSWSMTDVLKP